jgi:hypothetical protein
MYDLFEHVPGWLILITFTVVPAALAIFLHILFRRVVKPQSLLPYHDVAGFLVAVVGVLYGVVLGFLVISVWASYDLAQHNADAETNDLSDIFQLAKSFPEPARSQTLNLLARYTIEVRANEWTMLSRGEEDPKARKLMLDAFSAVADMQARPGAPLGDHIRLASLRAAALDSFRQLTSHRRQRVLDSQTQVPPILYFALVAGALILLAFVFMFWIDNLGLQLMMTGLVAGLIGLQIGVVFALDRPFWGSVHVEPHAWDLLISENQLAKLASGSQE